MSLPQINTWPAINQDAVKVEGRWDRGAIHRAIAVARQLCIANVWNGQDRITIFDPYITFDKLFGVHDRPATSLKSGEDYLIEAPVIVQSRPELQPEPDGDILWA